MLIIYIISHMKASSLYTSLGHGMISCVIDKMDVQRLTIFSVADNCPYVKIFDVVSVYLLFFGIQDKVTILHLPTLYGTFV